MEEWVAALVVAAIFAALYTFFGLITLLVYRYDKMQAENHEWRVPEARLHFLELLFGWFGAFIAQRVYRHKISKKSYQTVFWIIGVVHLCLLIFGFIPLISLVEKI